MLRIRNVYYFIVYWTPDLIFIHPGSRIPDSDPGYKNSSKREGGGYKKIWGWDPGSGKIPFTDPGSKRHQIPDPDPQHCFFHDFFLSLGKIRLQQKEKNTTKKFEKVNLLILMYLP